MSTQDPQFGVPNAPVATSIIESDPENLGVPALKRGQSLLARVSVPWAGWFITLRSWLYHPNSLAYQNSAGTSLTTGTQTALSFDTNAYDNGGIHSTSVNPTRFTAPVAGYYLAIGSIQAVAATGFLAIQIRKNGATNLPHSALALVANNNSGATIQVSTTLQLAANDYIEFWGQQNSGGTVTTSVVNTWGSLTLQSQP